MNEHRSFVWKSESAERLLDAVGCVRWCLACGVVPAGGFGYV